MTIRAIDTFHEGYWFRSRLEARWAIFFRTFGVSYFYEREGYKSTCPPNRFRYLPDFFIPEWDAFIEIKGSINPEELDDNIKKWSYLSTELNKRFIVLFTDVWPLHWTIYIPPRRDDYTDILDNRLLFLGLGQFCLDGKGSRFLMMYTSGYIPSLAEAVNEYINKVLESSDDAFSVFESLLESGDAELDKIVASCQYRDIARVCFFPLDNEPYYPLAIYKTLDEAEFILDKGDIVGISYNAGSRKQVCLGKSGNLILKSANGIQAMNLRFVPAKSAYTTARQARFEH